MTEERQLPWEEYWRAARLTEDDIVAAESALGVIFPDDFIAMMVRHQGMALEGWVLRRGQKKRSIPIGALSFFTRTAEGETENNLLSDCTTLRRNGYPADLIPFGGHFGQVHLALDYSTSPPCVVYVYPREIYLKPGDSYSEPLHGSRINGYWSTVKVADSITDMLAKLEPE